VAFAERVHGQKNQRNLLLTMICSFHPLSLYDSSALRGLKQLNKVRIHRLRAGVPLLTQLRISAQALEAYGAAYARTSDKLKSFDEYRTAVTV
jgi:hypothetical protein